jgi:hypothetical protein
MVYRDKEELMKLQEEYEKAEKPPLDLRLTPSFMRKEKTFRNKEIHAAFTRVQSGHRVFPGATAIHPVSTLSHRVNNGHGQNIIRPVNARFEFLL